MEFGNDRSEEVDFDDEGEDVDFDDDMEGFAAVSNADLSDEKDIIFTTYSLQSKFCNNIEFSVF